MSKITILHISDIHKVDDVNYQSLLESLKRDTLNWRNEHIPMPQFIVISGDLIQGAKTDSEIKTQYREVRDFLDNLVKLLLGGEKKRLIMVPGNHDVNRARSIQSMILSTKHIDDNIKDYFSPIMPDIRWNWHDQKFYKIDNATIYNSRFELFAEFYNDFYQGDYIYPNDPIKEGVFIPFPDEKIGFACFNSNYKLDHLNISGSIDEDSITSIGPQLEEYYEKGYLLIGVWHHNYYGEPRMTNYMDKSVFAPMLSYHLRIGLYGHQHIAQVAEEYSNMEEPEESRKRNKMLLISSGTLFGFQKVLQPGQRRQYNIIEIEMGNGQADVAINTREDNNPNPNTKIPLWQYKENRYSDDNKIHGRVFFKEIPIMNYIMEIDKRAKNNGNYEQACEELIKLGLDKVEPRKFYDSYIQMASGDYIKSQHENLMSNEGYILLCGVVIDDKDKVMAKKLLADKKLIEIKQQDAVLGEMYKELEELLN